QYAFERCTFDAGIGHAEGWPDPEMPWSATFRHCMFHDSIRLSVGLLTMEADTIQGGAFFRSNDDCHVYDCWFQGPGTPNSVGFIADLGIDGVSPGSATI